MNVDTTIDNLRDLTTLLQETTSKEQIHSWIKKWRNNNNEGSDSHDWDNAFPSMMDIEIKELEDTTVWVDKELMQDGKVIRISMMVF